MLLKNLPIAEGILTNKEKISGKLEFLSTFYEINQNDLAQKTDLGLRTIQRAFAGELTTATLEKICFILKVNPQWLVWGYSGTENIHEDIYLYCYEKTTHGKYELTASAIQFAKFARKKLTAKSGDKCKPKS